MALAQTLQDTVAQVRGQAKQTNASNAVDAIQALLLASSIAGYEGVRDAIDALNSILSSAANKKIQSVSLSFAWAPLLILARDKSRIASDLNISVSDFVTMLGETFDRLVRLWHLVKEMPLLFASFSLPPKTRPNVVTVHNWAFASAQFAESINRTPEIGAALDTAEAQPMLRDAIQRARILRSLAGPSVEVEPDSLESESRETFYAALGTRLVALARMDGHQARLVCNALVDQCFRQGPREIDAAVFLAAAHLGCSTERPGREHYERRVRNSSTYRDQILPLLQATSLASK
jgi:hypothetical protein